MIQKISKSTEYFNSMCQDFWIKCVGVFTGIIFNFHFGDISRPLLSAIFMLILFDFITAIIAVKKSGENIESSKIFNTALKYVLYFIAISAGYFTELVIGTDLFISKTIMIFLAMTELYSIGENIQKAGYAMPMQMMKNIKSLILKK